MDPTNDGLKWIRGGSSNTDYESTAAVGKVYYNGFGNIIGLIDALTGDDRCFIPGTANIDSFASIAVGPDGTGFGATPFVVAFSGIDCSVKWTGTYNNGSSPASARMGRSMSAPETRS